MKHYKTLADYFKESGDTQVALAKRIGVSQPTISLIKRSNGRVGAFQVLKRIARETGVPLESFGDE